MTDDIAAKIRRVHEETKPRIARIMDEAEVLAETGKYCRDNGIDWAQLKALIKAEIKDERDETGEGDAVTKILDKADAASAYADMLFRNMNNEKFSSSPEPLEKFEQLPSAPEKPADAIEPAAVIETGHALNSTPHARLSADPRLAIPDDLSPPSFLDRRPKSQEATS